MAHNGRYLSGSEVISQMGIFCTLPTIACNTQYVKGAKAYIFMQLYNGVIDNKEGMALMRNKLYSACSLYIYIAFSKKMYTCINTEHLKVKEGLKLRFTHRAVQMFRMLSCIQLQTYLYHTLVKFSVFRYEFRIILMSIFCKSLSCNFTSFEIQFVTDKKMDEKIACAEHMAMLKSRSTQGLFVFNYTPVCISLTCSNNSLVFFLGLLLPCLIRKDRFSFPTCALDLF